ncbi:ComF family protein [Falsirhodobacter algicola]|uniref:ComF family protein n=1 Tax=Falsirhodobacter algicola TaxID=2692330 RepID=A0A8J8MTE0_9RHOB|nr:ComF family protein [Falsirhodobacter algicola]QUS36066.1 ComF family protein [Falsirhodobacter algicola]
MGMQAALRLFYPPACLCCGAATGSDGLCGTCWRDTPFITGTVCTLCGTPLPGEGDGACDECLALQPPWAQGRAALSYGGNGRRLVLALKHGDRHDLIGPAAGWMLRAAAPMLVPGMIVAPVPLHWTRLLRRRFNQSALLSRAIARGAGLVHMPDLLIRPRRTPSQDGRDRQGRFENMTGALRLRRPALVEGRHILLVDDVMTTGATLSAATEVCLDAGAAGVSVVVLARVGKST